MGVRRRSQLLLNSLNPEKHTSTIYNQYRPSRPSVSLKDEHTRNEMKRNMQLCAFAQVTELRDLYIVIKLLWFSMVFYTVKCQGLYATTVT